MAMNFVKQIQYWFNTDPNAKQKIIFFAVTGLVLSLIFGLIWFLNFGIDRSIPNTSQVNQSLSTSAIRANDFDEVSRIKKINGVALGTTKTLFIQDDKSILFDREGRLVLNNNRVAGSPQFLPLSIYPLSNTDLIINQSNSSTVYQDNKFTTPGNGITQLVKVDNGFVYLQKDGGFFDLKFSQNLGLKEGIIRLAQLKSNLDPELVEIRILNNQIYLIAYQDKIRIGTAEIWLYESGSLTKIQTISSLQSILFGDSRILYTISRPVNQKTTYFSNVIDFSDSVEGKNQELNISQQLAEKKLQGFVWASRCDFRGQSEIICLIKQNSTLIDSYGDNDQIVTYKFDSGKIDTPFSGLSLSWDAIHSIGDKLYLVGQQNGLLYQLLN